MIAARSALEDALDAIRRSVSEQLTPVLAAHRTLAGRWPRTLDIEHACQRLRAGHIAYDPLDVIAGAGPLLLPYLRMTVALEHAGMATSEEATGARERGAEVLPLVMSWLSAEPLAHDPVKRAARRAAAIVGSSILTQASSAVGQAMALDEWHRPVCPCCGGLPEFALDTVPGRTLVCARCDTMWRAPGPGCVGCGAEGAPNIARIVMAELGYHLVICNGCGRYLKEPSLADGFEPLVDRAITSDMDAAAETRGLML